ncbi:predicted MarR family transcription regulator [Hoeflea halophila]|uniref:Predicted MarR family transcription regulator n=1 Tax=Hoeflea halophila TaxID=714899 RepID=A0A286HV89_9HYPH|nr:winged helix DNA-binding protein [Hoeflea halophila]SOE11416.1 predicted MarR family transcription regulator [Hoeflea halophila]
MSDQKNPQDTPAKPHDMPAKPRDMIVSSRHLATEEGWPSSEFEYGLILAYNGFARWMGRCTVAAGYSGLTTLEILVLHHIYHRSRKKRLSDICFQLNIEDTHTVNYALKKLQKAKLIEGEKVGKELFYSVTEQGSALCDKYREVREQCLVESLKHIENMPKDLHETATVLRTLSGLYDQASRAASSL